jgi:hypothetical protein
VIIVRLLLLLLLLFINNLLLLAWLLLFLLDTPCPALRVVVLLEVNVKLELRLCESGLAELTHRIPFPLQVIC